MDLPSRCRCAAGLAALSVAASALTGCTAADGPSAGAPRASAAGSGAASTTEASSRRTIGRRASAQRQVRAVRTLGYPFQQSADEVLAALDGSSQVSATRLRDTTRTAYARVRAWCGTPVPGIRRFVAAVERGTRRPLDAARIEATLQAFLRWAGPLGVGSVPRSVMTNRARCRDVSKRVRLGYAVWEEPSSYGKDMWVQLIAHNDTGHRLYAQLYGSLWASRVSPGLRYDPMFGDNRVPGAWEQSWGGSSADFMHIEAHSRSTQLLGIGELGRVHMRADGDFFAIRPEMVVQGTGVPWSCSLPVRREH